MLDPQTGSKTQHQRMYQCSRVSKHINMQIKSYHSVQLCVSSAECASWTWSCVFVFLFQMSLVFMDILFVHEHFRFIQTLKHMECFVFYLRGCIFGF